MANTERPIIIKKVKKIAAGSHGGAWKLAYADFVTAMMAFFLLMWLLASSSDEQRTKISEYFRNPFKIIDSPSLLSVPLSSPGPSPPFDITKIKKEGKGKGKSKFTKDEGNDTKEKNNSKSGSGSGSDSESGSGSESESGAGSGFKSESGSQSGSESTAESEVESEVESEAESEARSEAKKIVIEIFNLQKTKDQLQDLITNSELLYKYSGQFSLDITLEGLRIQVVDEDQRPMFEIGSDNMAPYAMEIMRQIAPVIDQLPNRISITGHTDSRPYGGAGRGYSNWELSTDRANAARRALVTAGIKESKFLRIVGLANSIPLDPINPLNNINRRISIIVMKHMAEQELIENSGPIMEVGKGAAPAPKGAPILFPTVPTIPPKQMLPNQSSSKAVIPPVHLGTGKPLTAPPTASSIKPITQHVPPSGADVTHRTH